MPHAGAETLCVPALPPSSSSLFFHWNFLLGLGYYDFFGRHVIVAAFA
jgi:hypothetical protein